MARGLFGFLIIAVTVNACFLCEGPVTVGTGKTFWSGFLNGLQINPNYPSPCIAKFNNVKTDWSQFKTDTKSMLKNVDVSMYFQVVSDFADLFNDLDDSVSLCQLDLVTNQLSNLFTPSEASVLAVRVTTYSVPLIAYWQGFATNIKTDKYTAGNNLGKLFSLLFDYQI